MSKETVRKFEGGACRDGNAGKLEYGGYINPLCDYSFAYYMQSHQIIGGEYRTGDNWQRGDGIPPESLYDSLVRHMEMLKLLIKGYRVFEWKDNEGVTKYYVTNQQDHVEETEGPIAEEKTIVGELNAIRFNSEALKLHHLKHGSFTYVNHQ